MNNYQVLPFLLLIGFLTNYSPRANSMGSLVNENIQVESGRLFTIAGSNTVGAKLAPNWVRDYLLFKGLKSVEIKELAIENEYRVVAFNRMNEAVFIDIAAHGSSTGFSDLLSSKADIAMSSRPIKPREFSVLADLGDMRSFEAENIVAIDGLAIIVNRDNPVKTLTVDSIAKIFSGKYSNWKEVGGENLPIHLYARDNNSGTWDTFKSLVLGGNYRLEVNARRFESNDQLSDLVSKDEGGIGFVGLASVRQSKVLAVSDGNSRSLKPKPLYVATEDYPLSRRLYMYVSPNEENPYVRDFLTFTHSQQAQERVEEIGFVSQKPLGVPFDHESTVPESYASVVRNAERLSINFRFKPGSAKLDNKAQQDILRLVDYVSNIKGLGKRIQLIGFGDQKSRRSRELVLSQMRALAVKSALHKRSITSETVLGFGSWLPVASHSESGKLKNQRVEVWLYDDKYHSEINLAKKNIEEQNNQAILSAL